MAQQSGSGQSDLGNKLRHPGWSCPDGAGTYNLGYAISRGDLRRDEVHAIGAVNKVPLGGAGERTRCKAPPTRQPAKLFSGARADHLIFRPIFLKKKKKKKTGPACIPHRPSIRPRHPAPGSGPIWPSSPPPRTTCGRGHVQCHGLVRGKGKRKGSSRQIPPGATRPPSACWPTESQAVPVIALGIIFKGPPLDPIPRTP